MNVSLPPELERLVRAKVDGGLYASECEVFEEALRLLDDRDRLHASRRGETTTEEGRELTDLPFFGMAADRDEFSDSEAWVRRSREAWQQRASRPD